jgi:lysozyme
MNNINTKGLELIKKHEGFRDRAYKCPAGHWTIGYGQRIKNPNGGFVSDKIAFDDLPLKQVTELQAKEMLLEAVEKEYCPIVNKAITTKINDNQYSALVSFVYNLGRLPSTLAGKVNSNPQDFNSIKETWLQYNKATVNGELKPFKGLVIRRQDEFNFYCEPIAENNSVNLTTSKQKKNMGFFSSVANFFAKNKETIGETVDLASNFIPGGTVVSGVVKIASRFLFDGDEEKTPQEVMQRIEESDPETINKLQEELLSAGFDHQELMQQLELQKEEQDTLQAIETTHQAEIQRDIKYTESLVNLISSGKGGYVIGTYGFYYIIIAVSIAYWTIIDVEKLAHIQLGLSMMFNLLALLPYKFILGSSAFNKLMDGMVDSVLGVISLPSAFGQFLKNKVKK